MQILGINSLTFCSMKSKDLSLYLLISSIISLIPPTAQYESITLTLLLPSNNNFIAL